MALALRMRRCSLLDTNQRRRRTAVRMPPSVTFLRKRLSRPSCDSPSRSLTVMPYHLLPYRRTAPKSRDSTKLSSPAGQRIPAHYRRLPRFCQKPRLIFLDKNSQAELLGVSRSVVREAMRILERAGLIVIKPGRGAFVQDPSSQSISRPLKTAWSFAAT